MSPGSHAADDGSFGRSAGIQAGRAAVLIGVAVVIGFLLLHRSPGSTSVRTAFPRSSTRPDTVGHTGAGFGGSGVTTSTNSPTTTATLKDPKNVKVLVANGTGSAGLAGRVSATLRTDGYVTLTPTDSTQKVTATVVYFAPNYGPEAAALAAKLSLPRSVVSAMPTPAPVTSLGGANVLVVAGPNLASSSSNTTSTT